jgi:methyl-accepting chemotaxis protein
MDEESKIADEHALAARNLMLIVSLSAIFLGGGVAFVILRAVSKAINQVISQLNENSASVTTAAQQIASSSEELSQAATEQASSLEETSSAVEEMSSMIRRNAEGARKSADISRVSSASATRGKQVVEGMVTAMADIDGANNRIMAQITESNQRISEIVKVIAEIGNKTKVINDIVFQTKLLSFNASVEAARAGEHGKGFAVVAEEVGNLAQMSGNAAKEISAMLEGSIQKVDSIAAETKSKVEALVSEGKSRVEVGTHVAKECGKVLDEIVTNVDTVSRMVGDISTASDEQARGVEEITKAMAQLDQVTQQNAAVSEEAASAAEELSAQAVTLGQVVRLLVQSIKGSSGASEAPAFAPVAAGPRMTAPVAAKTSPRGKLLHLKSGRRPAGELAPQGLPQVVGSDVAPSENDPRFKDV